MARSELSDVRGSLETYSIRGKYRWLADFSLNFATSCAFVLHIVYRILGDFSI